jgi:predicted DNA-binding protein
MKKLADHVRTNFYFPRDLLDRLKAISKRTGYTVSALLRSGAEREILVQEEYQKDSGEEE